VCRGTGRRREKHASLVDRKGISSICICGTQYESKSARQWNVTVKQPSYVLLLVLRSLHPKLFLSAQKSINSSLRKATNDFSQLFRAVENKQGSCSPLLHELTGKILALSRRLRRISQLQVHYQGFHRAVALYKRALSRCLAVLQHRQ